MILLKGQVLKHREQKINGGTLDIYQVLDENERFSRVIDVADFDGHLRGQESKEVSVPVSVRLNRTEKGGAFMNFATAGAPL